MITKGPSLWKIMCATVLTLLKSFWDATVFAAWGISTFFLLAGLITYFKADASLVITLLQLTSFCMKYWLVFWVVAFIAYSWSGISNKLKSDKDEE